MNPETFTSWQIWAVLSAVFAALTAIFAKVGSRASTPIWQR
jgi:transporter family protein